MKNLISKICFYSLIVISSIALYSCLKEEKGFKCTTYLQGTVYNEQIVSDCSLCFAPQGYTTTCEKE